MTFFVQNANFLKRDPILLLLSNNKGYQMFGYDLSSNWKCGSHLKLDSRWNFGYELCPVKLEKCPRLYLPIFFYDTWKCKRNFSDFFLNGTVSWKSRNLTGKLGAGPNKGTNIMDERRAKEFKL